MGPASRQKQLVAPVRGPGQCLVHLAEGQRGTSTWNGLTLVSSMTVTESIEAVFGSTLSPPKPVYPVAQNEQ
jgi:hypothetical protein